MASSVKGSGTAVAVALVAAVVILCVTGVSGATQPFAGIVQAGRGVFAIEAAVDGQLYCNDDCSNPGLVNTVFDMSASQGRTFDGIYDLPDGWTVVPNRECDLDTTVDEVHDWMDYQSTVSESETVSKHFLWWHSSHTDWFQAVHTATESYQSVYVRKSLECKSYKVQRSGYDQTASLTADFKLAVRELPSNISEYHQSLPKFMSFVSLFGTHIIKWAQFGGKVVDMTLFEQTSFTDLKAQYGDLDLAAKLAALCKLGDQVICNPSNPNWAAYQAFESATVQRMSSWIPFFPEQDPDFGHGGFQWSEAVEQNPDIISYSLDNITDILTAAFFPNDTDIAAKQQMLTQFIANDFCSMLPAPGCPVTQRQARWTTPATGLPQVRVAAVSASNATDDQATFYVIGGMATAAPVTEMSSLRWDEPSQQWITFTSPSVLNNGGSAVPYAAATFHQGRVVFSGGAILDGRPMTSIATVFNFDPVTHFWQQMTPLNSARQRHCLVSVNNRLFAFGGLGVAGALASSESFDPIASAWISLQNMPSARYGMACAVQGNFVFLVGGLDSTNTVSGITFVYDTVKDLWLANDIPVMGLPETPRSGHSVVIVRDQLFVLGGVNQAGQALNDVQVLELPSSGQSPSWTTGCPLPAALAYTAAAIVQTASGSTLVHVAGGTTSNGDSSAHYAFEIFDSDTLVTCPGISTSASISSSSSSSAAAATATAAASLAHTMTQLKLQGQKKVATAAKKARMSFAPHAATPASTSASSASEEADLSAVHPASSYVGQGFLSAFGTLTSSQVFDSICSNCFQQGNFLNNRTLPDAVHVNNLEACAYEASSLSILDEVDLQASMQGTATAWAKAGVPLLFKFSFTADANFDTQASALASSQNIFMQAASQCTSFQVQHSGDLDAINNGLSANFKAAILNAPEALDPANPEPFLDILREFGDSIVVGTDFGARVKQSFRMTSQNFSSAISMRLNLNAAAKASILYILGKSVSDDLNINVELNAQMTHVTSENITDCKPFCPPRNANISTNSSAWVDSIIGDGTMLNGAAAPISFVLAPLTFAVDPLFFNASVSAKVEVVRAALDQLINDGTWCAAIPSCSLPTRQPRWSLNPALPTAVSYPGVACTDAGELFVFGGSVSGLSQAKTFVYNVTADPNSPAGAGRMLPPLQNARQSPAVALVNDAIYAIGGFSGVNALQSVEVFLTNKQRVWTEGPQLPLPLATATAVVVNDMVYVVGGQTTGGNINCFMQILDTTTQTWTTGQHSIPQSCVFSSGVADVGDILYIFGGTMAKSVCSNSVLMYTTSIDEWRVRFQLPSASCVVNVQKLQQTEAEYLVVLSDLGTSYIWNAATGEFRSAPASPLSTAASSAATTPDGSVVFAGGNIGQYQLLNYIANTTSPAPAAAAAAHINKRNVPSSSSSSSSSSVKAIKPTKTAGQAHKESMSFVAPQRAAAAAAAASPSGPQADAGTRFPYVHTMGFGYNTISGDPLNVHGDPGWARSPVFNVTAGNLSWTQKMYVPGDNVNWVIPENVGWSSHGAADCKYASEAFSLHDTVQWQKLAQGQHQLVPSERWGWPAIFGYEYSASETFQRVEEAQVTLNGTLQVGLGICRRYELLYDLAFPPFDLSSEFVSDLNDLPTSLTPSLAPEFLTFVNKYGLYLPSRISFGSVVAQVSVLGNAGASAMIRNGVDISFAARASLLVLMGMDAKAAAQGQDQALALFQTNLDATATLCIPKCPPTGDDILDDPTPWIDSIKLPEGLVSPVSMTLTPLPDAVWQLQQALPAYLRGDDLAARLDALAEFVNTTYCSMTPGCQPAVELPRWETGFTPLRQAVASAVTLQNKDMLYVVGGDSGSGPVIMMQFMNLTNGYWSTGQSLVQPRMAAAGVVVGDSLWVCGGFNTTAATVSNTCEVLSPGLYWVLQNATLNVERANHAMSAFNGVMYVYGGLQNKGVLTSSIEAYNKGVWTLLTVSLPAPLFGMSAVTLASSTLLLGGGTSPTTLTPNITVFDGTTVSLHPLVLPMPVSGLHAAAVSSNDDNGNDDLTTVIVSGGLQQTPDGAIAATTSSWVINLENTEIRAGPQCPWAVQRAGVAVTDGYMLLLGGVTDASTAITANVTMLAFANSDN